MFCDLNKFDLIATYDDASKSLGPPEVPFAKLVHAIYETESHKILKRVPVLLIGSKNGWKREFGEQALVKAELLVGPLL